MWWNLFEHAKLHNWWRLVQVLMRTCIKIVTSMVWYGMVWYGSIVWCGTVRYRYWYRYHEKSFFCSKLQNYYSINGGSGYELFYFESEKNWIFFNCCYGTVYTIEILVIWKIENSLVVIFRHHYRQNMIFFICFDIFRIFRVFSF